MNESEKIIKFLKMIPHPEGGHFVESYRDKNISIIYYLLKKNEKSHWHKLNKNEILHFYRGSPLLVYISKDEKTSITKVLGNDFNNNQYMHLVVNAHNWFSMESRGEFSLIGCTVSPPFEYDDFKLAPKGWFPKKK